MQIFNNLISFGFLLVMINFKAAKSQETNNISKQKVLKNHTDSIVCLCQVNDKLIATGSLDSTIKIWDLKESSDKLPLTLYDHTDTILSLVKVNTEIMASGAADNTIRIWNITSGIILLQTLTGQTSSLVSLIKLNDSFVASASNEFTFIALIKVWSTKDWRVKQTISTPQRITSLIALNSSHLAVGHDFDLTIRIYDIYSNGQLIFTMRNHTQNINVLVQLNSSHLISGSDDRTIKLWDINSGVLTRTLRTFSDGVKSLLNLNNGYIVVGLDSVRVFNNLVLMSMVDWKVKSILVGHSNSVNSLIQLGQSQIASASDDRTAIIWQQSSSSGMPSSTSSTTALTKTSPKTSYSIYKTLTGHSDWVWCLVQLNDERLATGSFDSTIKIWNLKEAKLNVVEFSLESHTGEIYSLAKLNEQTIASGSADTTVKIWNWRNGMLIETLTNHNDHVWGLIRLNDSFFLSESSDGRMYVWSTSDLVLKKNNNIPEGIHTLLILDSDRVAVGDEYGSIRIYDINSGGLIFEMSGHKGAIYSLIHLNDYQIVSGGEDGTIKLWYTNNGTISRNLYSFTEPVLSLVNLNDGFIAAGLFDTSSNLMLIDTSNWCVQSYLTGHTSTVNSLILLSNRQIASGSVDQTVIIWH